MPELVETGLRNGNGDLLGAMIDALEQMQRTVGAESEKLAGRLVGSSQDLLEQWARMCQEALADQAEAVHERRGKFLDAIASCSSSLKRLHGLVRGGHRDTAGGALLADIAALDKLHAKLTNRWHTAEDLEDLAAESLANPPEKLEAVRKKYGFPEGWYAQDSKPF